MCHCDECKLCSFCDQKRTIILIINDEELPLCGNCERDLKQKLKTPDTTFIPYSPYEPYTPIPYNPFDPNRFTTGPIWQIDLQPNVTCGAIDVTYHTSCNTS